MSAPGYRGLENRRLATTSPLFFPFRSAAAAYNVPGTGAGSPGAADAWGADTNNSDINPTTSVEVTRVRSMV